MNEEVHVGCTKCNKQEFEVLFKETPGVLYLKCTNCRHENAIRVEPIENGFNFIKEA